jgi:hypothetical protein
MDAGFRAFGVFCGVKRGNRELQERHEMEVGSLPAKAGCLALEEWD